MYVSVYHPSAHVRRTYLPGERMQVSGVGLGGLDGINIGKMFTRMFTFKPSSFKFSNIMGAIGSGVTNFMTLGAASAFAPKQFGAHNTQMKQVGMGVSAAAVAAGGVALAPTIGSTLSPVLGAAKTVGSTLWSGIKSIGSILPSGETLKTGMDVLSTGLRVMGGTGAQQGGAMVVGVPVDMGTGAAIAPQPITGYGPTAAQITGVADMFNPAYYPTPEQQGLMYAGQAGAGVSPAYYGGSQGTVTEPSTIIEGVSDTSVYIAGGVLALGLLYAVL